MTKLFPRVLALWLPFLVALSGIFLFTAWAVQQNYRLSLNDPQIQMAEDAARAIASGVQADQVVPAGKVDIANSLAPWLAVYTNAGVPLLASGELHGALPKLPQGVFDLSGWNRLIIGHHFNTAPINENRFTWQPEFAVRQAVVLVHFDSPNGVGYVAAGRSMQEVESRESILMHAAGFFWGGTALGVLAAIFILAALGWI